MRYTRMSRYSTGLVAICCFTGCLSPAMNPVHRPIGADNVKQHSLDNAARMDRVQNLLADGFYDDAREELNLIIADGQQHPRAFFMLGEISAYQEHYEEALNWLERSIQMAPTWPAPRLLQARVYIELKRLAAAKQIFASFEDLFPRHPAGPYGRGWIALLNNQPVEAAAAFTESLQRNPNFHPAIAGRARLARAQGDTRLERELLGRFIYLRPMDPFGHRRMAQIDLEDGLLVSAKRGFERSYQLSPNRETAESLRQIAIQLGDNASAQMWEGRAQ